jgi:hypothetical protein
MAEAAILTVLDSARWTPSGDNTQVWRFELIDDESCVIHGFDTRDHSIYDVDGHPSHIALGALLETITIAASSLQRRADFVLRPESGERAPLIDVRLTADAAVTRDPLVDAIERRCVQRRALKTRLLTRQEKSALEQAAGAYRVIWLEGLKTKLQLAGLLFRNAGIRLTMPEAYAVHREIIEWRAKHSYDRIPDQALGLDPVTTRLMEWVMQSWGRVNFFNRYLGGTIAPRLQLDLIPALACGAHFILVAEHPPQVIADYLTAGRALQHFWLTATHLGLQLQPEQTPLIFAQYVSNGRHFSQTPGLWDKACEVTRQLDQLIGVETRQKAVFMGRIGAGKAAAARSLRRPLKELLISTAQED